MKSRGLLWRKMLINGAGAVLSNQFALSLEKNEVSDFFLFVFK